MVLFQSLQVFGVSVDAVCPAKISGDLCPTSIHQSSSGHQTYSETRGHNFKLNATFDKVNPQSYDGLVIPGWRAPEYLAHIPDVVNIVPHFSNSGKPIAAICHAPLILAAADAVEGRRCTGYPSVGPVLVAAGPRWVKPENLAVTVVDGNLITGVTYRGHPEFIRHFMKALGGSIGGFNKRVLFLCGDYMEDYEVTVPFQSLQALGYHVYAVCPKMKAGDACPTAVHNFEGDQTYSEKPGYDFTLNASYDDVNPSSYDALVIPGGRSPPYLALDKSVIALVKHFMESDKPVASIGHGQLILAAANVLKERKCTAYTGLPDPIDLCITDGNLVTAAAWQGHPEFISQLMALLGIQVSF